jgi:uncharacterized protein (DUF433 family)
MSTKIEIVDRGRGMQLSTSRVTVQDLVPYFLSGASREEIIRGIPSLTANEIAVVERYFLEHKEELLAQDQRIRERAAARRNPPEVEESLRTARLERLQCARQRIRQKKQGQNGNHASS